MSKYIDIINKGTVRNLKMNYEQNYVDTAQVVRCKDCKHREYDDFMKEFICDLDAADPYERSRCADDDEWFCKDGERNE